MTVETAQAPASRRNEKVGNVVSTKMQKTIVVEVEMRKAHRKYKRIVKSSKKFYAHDEQNSARVGDVVRIRETRPTSKLKRWALEEIVRRSSLGQIEEIEARVSDASFSKVVLNEIEQGYEEFHLLIQQSKRRLNRFSVDSCLLCHDFSHLSWRLNR